jgi:hypothetical protein
MHDAGVAPADVVTRYSVALEISNVIDRYLPTDQHPRTLFALRGQLALAMAHAAGDALELPAAAKRAALFAAGVDIAAPGFDADRELHAEQVKRLMQGRADLQNALVADTLAPLVEPRRELEILMRLGDVLLILGEPIGALDAYGRAVDAFVDADAPVDQVFELANAVGRLAVLRSAMGECRRAPVAAAAERGAQRRGFAMIDLCALTSAGAPLPALFQVIRPLLAPVLSCTGMPLGFDSPDYGRDALALQGCLQMRSANDPRVASPFVAAHSGASLDADIERALGSAL